MSLTHWYYTQNPSEAMSLTSAFFLVFEYTISATATGNGGSFAMQCLACSADLCWFCFTELNLIIWDIVTATHELSFDVLLALPSSMIWIICTRSNGTKSLWYLQVRSPSKTSLFRNSCFQRMWAALAVIIPSPCVLLLHTSNTALPTSLSRVKRTIHPSFASHRPGTCSNSWSFNLVLWTHSAFFCKAPYSSIGSCTSTWDPLNTDFSI